MSFPARILIVKTSSLGDIVQSLNIVDELKRRFPSVLIDWVVESAYAPIVQAHPSIHRAISLNIKGRKGLWQGVRELRRERYDLIFDLQGNCKSGVVTFLARGKVKVGYGLKSVREWPNILATQVRFNVSRQQNIRQFYLGLIDSYFEQVSGNEWGGVEFKIDERQKGKVRSILAPAQGKKKIMVCPGSKWKNKQLKETTWIAFLQKIDAYFFLMWGSDEEKRLCKEIADRLSHCQVVEKLSLPTWQNLMGEVDLVIAVDSSALHLCATTSTPTFSIFGPTASTIFKPVGERHTAIQGRCPYGRTFEKQCPILRTCPTGACIKEITPEALFEAMISNKFYFTIK